MPRKRTGTGSFSPLLLLPGALGCVFITLPILCLPRGVTTEQFRALRHSTAAHQALQLSLYTTTLATLVVVVLGIPLAHVVAHAKRFHSLLRGILLIPLTLPPVVTGLALLAVFGRKGLLGPALSTAHITVAFSTTAVIIAQTFVALPFFTLAFANALTSAGQGPERTAAGLGARPWHVWSRVTLPRLRPALISSIALAYARALGEFGATLTFAGSFTGTTRTLPLEVYLQREVDPDAAQALSLCFVVVALVLVGLTVWADRRTQRSTAATETRFSDVARTERVL